MSFFSVLVKMLREFGVPEFTYNSLSRSICCRCRAVLTVWYRRN